MTTPSLRLKVTDFLATDFEQEVFQELMKIKQLDYLSGVHFHYIFGMIENDRNGRFKCIEPFIKYWKTRVSLILN